MTAASNGYALGRGTLVSVIASMLFGVVYYLTPATAPFTALEFLMLRLPLTFVVLTCTLLAIKQGGLIRETGRQMLRQPWRIPLMAFCGFILASQLWIFAYAPLAGRGLQATLGYLLLPLVLALVGRFLYRDHLTLWHWVAVAIAAAGIGYEILRTGELAWEALWIAFTYPFYFVVRRAIGFNHFGGMFWETLVGALPCAILFFIQAPQIVARGATVTTFVIAFGVAALVTAALLLWILSSKLLPISTFGLLSYLEPALLVVASLLLGERIAAAEVPLYCCIWIAVLIIIGVGVHTARLERKAKQQPTTQTGQLPIATAQMPADREHWEDSLAAPATGSIPIVDTHHKAE